MSHDGPKSLVVHRELKHRLSWNNMTGQCDMITKCKQVKILDMLSLLVAPVGVKGSNITAVVRGSAFSLWAPVSMTNWQFFMGV